MATSRAVRAQMEELSRFFPAGIEYLIPYDTSPFVVASIQKVLMTLLEAVLLVFAVMFLFLQSFRKPCRAGSRPIARSRAGSWCAQVPARS